ncbi:MAG TPA: transposase [Kofleriaceae bacterium]|nr:transposase [Kofleriaceae bacterium]
MSRPPRLILPNHPNHIVNRGNNRRRLFSYREDYRTFIRLLANAYRKENCELNAACLLDNHTHALNTPPSVTAASACAKRYAQRYAQIRNLKREGSGKLFEQRFYSKPVTSVIQLAYTTMYIEANPLRAGLVTDALDYPWSTYALHAGEPERSAFPSWMWTPSRWYLGLGRSADERAATYRQLFEVYVRGGLRPDHADELEKLDLLDRPYTLRLRRPDESRAAESAASRWPFARKRRAMTGGCEGGE